MAEPDLLIDRQAAAVVPSDSDLRSWAAGERVFISSVMSSLRDERRAVADAVRDIGAEPVWFEEFGGRDQDATEAYLTEVASSSIFVSLLGRDYGKMLSSGFSATHAEYLEARDDGLRVSAWVRNAPDMDGHQRNFITDLQVFHVTGTFETPADLASKVGRRLRKMAAETLAPWCKLGSIVFRARSIRDDGASIVVDASVHSERWPAVTLFLTGTSGPPFFAPSSSRT